MSNIPKFTIVLLPHYSSSPYTALSKPLQSLLTVGRGQFVANINLSYHINLQRALLFGDI